MEESAAPVAHGLPMSTPRLVGHHALEGGAQDNGGSACSLQPSGDGSRGRVQESEKQEAPLGGSVSTHAGAPHASALCAFGLEILGCIARSQTEDLLKDIAHLESIESGLLESIGRKRKRAPHDASEPELHKRRELKNRRACVLCRGKDPAIAFVPCGHACCEDCGSSGSESRVCPVCGELLSSAAQRIYLS